MTGLKISNARSVNLAAIPNLPIADFRDSTIAEIVGGARLVALFVWQVENQPQLFAVLATKSPSALKITRSSILGNSYPALTPNCPSAQFFEREIFEQHQIVPTGHPYLRPVRRTADRAIGDWDFLAAENFSLHQVGVGPVHAGVIEPGHFRFTCDGEKVLMLEIALGYQHRGIENKICEALRQSQFFRALKFSEIIAGDSTIAHATAFAQIIGAFHRQEITLKMRGWREVALELERLANHIGDLGALAGDAGFLPSMSFCGRLRGDILNTTALFCGNRFGRGFITIDGVDALPDLLTSAKISDRLQTIEKECADAIKLLFASASVAERLERIGRVSVKTAKELGAVGVVARASGLNIDVREDFPASSIVTKNYMPIVAENGDVAARAKVRWSECKKSFRLLKRWLATAHRLDDDAPENPLAASDAEDVSQESQEAQMAISLVEGWRGEVCHLAMTNADRQICNYKIIDPSFHNWFVLAQALRDEQISNFPLCNKSFNLSYCGTDL